MDGDASPWRGRRVLVAGCTGFLGSAVTRELIARGATVVGLVRNRHRAAVFSELIGAGKVRLVPGRVEDTARLHTEMAVHEVSAAFDLTGSDRGTTNLLRAAALYHPRVPVVTARPANQLRIAPNTPTPVPLGVARFGELFGPDRDLNGFVSQALGALLSGERPPRTDGPRRDFVFVRDAARACLALAEAVAVEGRSQDAAFRSGWEFGEPEVVAVLAGRTPVAPQETPPNPLGWQPEGTFAEALAETIDWHRALMRSRPDAGFSAARAA
jgi:nucleoside-diphosphate-sugar epimerase